MARRFPIMTTAGAGFGFLFGQFGQILSAMWFPSLLYGLNVALLCTARVSGDDPPWLVYGEFVAALLLLQCIVTVRFIDFRLEKPERANFLGIRFGVDELRVLFSSLLILAIVIVILLLTVSAASAAAYGLTRIVPPVHYMELNVPVRWPASVLDWPGFAWALLGVFPAAGGAAAFYLWQRLSLFPAVVVVDEKFGLAESWTLTSGNGWRLGASFMVTMLLVLHLMAVMAGLFLLLIGGIVFSLPHGVRLDVAELFPIRMDYVGSIELFPVFVLLLGVIALAFQSVYAGFLCRAYEVRWDILHGIRTEDDEADSLDEPAGDAPPEQENDAETETEGPAPAEAAAAKRPAKPKEV